MGLQESRAAGMALADRVFSQANDYLTSEMQREALMQRLAGVKGVTEEDIAGLMTADPKERARSISSILSRENGLDALQAISSFSARMPDERAQAGVSFPGSTVRALIESVRQGGELSPEAASMQVPEEALPSIMALAGTTESVDARRDIAALRNELAWWQSVSGMQQDIAQLRFDMTKHYGERGAAGRAESEAFGKNFASIVLSSLGDPQWPDETDRRVATTIGAFADAAFAAAQQDALASGRPLDQRIVQSQVWQALNDMGIRPGAKEKDLERAVAELRARMGSAVEPTASPEPGLPDIPPIPRGGQRALGLGGRRPAVLQPPDVGAATVPAESTSPGAGRAQAPDEKKRAAREGTYIGVYEGIRQAAASGATYRLSASVAASLRDAGMSDSEIREYVLGIVADVKAGKRRMTGF